MLLEKNNELGKISISNNVFAQIIKDSLELCRGRVWPATKKGKQIGNEWKFNLSDFASTVEVKGKDQDNNFELRFYVITKFGSSIKSITDVIMDSIFEKIKSTTGEYPNEVTIVVVGVKSRLIAKREIEVVRKNEFK